MNEQIEAKKLPTSCITSSGKPCPIKVDVDNLERGDKEAIKSNLFFMLGSMDTIITESIKYIEKGLPFYVRATLEVKNGFKSMALNISNSNLNSNDILILGGLQIGFGIATEVAIGALVSAGIIAGGWTLVLSIGVSSLIAYFLSDLYLYLKDKSIELWEKIKTEFDSTTASIASLIEKNVSSLRDFTSNIINKVSSWVDEFDVNNLIIQGNHSSGEIEYNPAHPYANPQRNLSSPDYQSLIELLLHKDSNALDIDTLLHTFPNYLAYPTHSYSTKDSINSSLSLSTPKDALPIHIKAQCFNHKKEALSNREIYVYSPNFYSFVDRAKSDENGFIEFHNAYVSSKMTNSDLYFVLNRYGLDEEQKDFHIKISPSKTIQPKDKQVGELLEQRLSFEKNIPKAITLNDNIKPNIKVNAIEYIPQEYNHNSFNSPLLLEHHLIESITLQAHYVLKDSHKKNIQGDEQSLLKESIQRYKHKTKWGYIVFDRDEEIEQTLKQVNKTQPLIYSKRFKELENIKGEIVNIPFKEEWENKQIRFFAYLWRANRDVGIDVEFEDATHFVNEAYYDKIIIKAKDDDSEMLQILYTPYHMDDPALQDMSAMFIPILRGLKIFSKFGSNTPKEPITWKKIEQRLDTLHNVKKLNLPRNKEAIYEVSSLKELRELKDEFTHGTYRLPDKIEAKGVREEYALRDHTNTIVQYRAYSNQRMSGGKPTIDIRTQTTHNGKQINMIHKIHIRYTKIKKEDGTFIIKILEWFEK